MTHCFDLFKIEVGTEGVFAQTLLHWDKVPKITCFCGSPTCLSSYWSTDWLTDCLIDWYPDWLNTLLTVWLIDKLTDWLIDLLTDSITDTKSEAIYLWSCFVYVIQFKSCGFETNIYEEQSIFCLVFPGLDALGDGIYSILEYQGTTRPSFYFGPVPLAFKIWFPLAMLGGGSFF